MKNFVYRTLMVFVVFMTVILFFSCDDKEPSGVDFTSHNANFSILVRNNTNQRLVAFKNDLREDMLIGGIPANASNHGLPNDTSLFSNTESFQLILLTEAQYNANINNLNSQRNTPFTTVWVFFNRNADNNTVYEIDSGLGGTNRLTVVNGSSSINIELRVGGIAGPTLGFATAGMLETVFRLQDGNYNIFPVFRRHNTIRDVLETVYPTMEGGNGNPWFQSLSFGEGTTSHTMLLRDLLSTLTFSSGAAWVVVENDTSAGGIRFIEGGNVRETATGLTNIMNGNPRTFQIDMNRIGNNFSESREFNNWRFGVTNYEVALDPVRSVVPVNPLVIERDKMYTIRVTGATALTVEAFVSAVTIIDSNELAGEW
jgi:hypothetical protein